MSEKFKNIKPQMKDDELLSVILDQIMDDAEHDVAEAINFCAIPHRFNEKIISWLRGEPKVSSRTQFILSQLKKSGLVLHYKRKHWMFHKMTRDLLLKRWCHTNLAGFKQLNVAMSAFYQNSVENRFEFIYHLLAGGDPKGFELLVDEIAQANRFYYFSTAEKLLNLADEPCIKLSKSQLSQLQYYSAELAALSGYWDDALPVLKSLKRKKIPAPLQSKVYLRLGTVYNRRGQWKLALESYQRCLELGKSVDPNIRAWAYSGLGLIHRWRGAWLQAAKFHNSAIRVAKHSGDQLWLGRAVNNLGEVYQQTGQLEKAKDSYQESVRMKKKIGDTYGLLWTYINLGSLYIELNQWSKASKYLDQGLAMARELKSPAEEAWALEFMGELQMQKENFKRANDCFTKALEICETITIPHRKANILAKTGSLYVKEGRIGEAITAFEAALEIYRKLKSLKSDDLEKTLKNLKATISP